MGAGLPGGVVELRPVDADAAPSHVHLRRPAAAAAAAAAAAK